jgi:hypothetical protein
MWSELRYHEQVVETVSCTTKDDEMSEVAYMKRNHPRTGSGVLCLVLPGPDRKRSMAIYTCRVTYRNTVPDMSGCVMTWEVSGGRIPYQVALERNAIGSLKWHCTCADMVYRSEQDVAHLCKHIRGILDNLPTLWTPVARFSADAA